MDSLWFIYKGTNFQNLTFKVSEIKKYSTTESFTADLFLLQKICYSTDQTTFFQCTYFRNDNSHIMYDEKYWYLKAFIISLPFSFCWFVINNHKMTAGLVH